MKAAFFGQFLIDKGVISFHQLEDAIRLQADTNLKLGQLILEKGMLSQQEVKEILDLQKKEDVYFGGAAVALGFLTLEQIDELLNEQKDRHILVGEALMQLGHLNQEKLAEYLMAFEKEQKSAKEQGVELYQEQFKNEQLFIDQFLMYTIKLLARAGGILAKSDHYEVVEKEIDVKSVAVEMHFTGDENNTLNKYLVMSTKEMACRIASNLYQGSTESSNEVSTVAAVDALSELINMICAQVCINFEEIGRLGITLSQKVIIDHDQMQLKYILKDNQKAIYVSLATPFGEAIGFLLVFLKK